jgi:hypothetical protein
MIPREFWAVAQRSWWCYYWDGKRKHKIASAALIRGAN